MAGQGFNRREAIRITAMAAAISQFAGFEHWVFAHQEHKAQNKKSTEPYAPRFFTPQEFLLLTVLSELIIPTDETAGAREAGCAEFTDFIISHDVDKQPLFRSGLKWLDQHSIKNFNKPFVEIEKQRQEQILEQLAYKKKFKAGEKEGQEFFKLIRNYTVMGYYTSKPGMEALGVPTLHTYATGPECPHKDDPEHKHLNKVNV